LNTNFDQVVDRKGTNSVKWDLNDRIYGSNEILPMWVADMDFKAPEVVIEALKTQLDHGVFGYTSIPDSTKDAIISWVTNRHNWKLHNEWISYSSGVVTAMSSVVQALTQPGDKIVVQTPIYPPFFQLIERNKRELITSENKLVNSSYEMDFDDLEQKLTKDVKVFMLCNPHNPGGKVWSSQDLKKLGELCLKNNILILSDDIHSDILIGEKPYTPIASLSDELAQQTITFIAPTKTFNIAGLQASVIITPNKSLKVKIDNFQSAQGFFTLNTMGIVGMEAAYGKGEPWFENLLSYLKENLQRLESFLKEQLPMIKLIKPDASYLAWLDLRELGLSDEQIKKLLVEKGKLGLEPGPKYGKGGEGFVRINLGCPKETLEEGLRRLKIAFGDL